MRKELSSSAIRKFNGYDLLKNNLQKKEATDFIPIDIVYEPTLDKEKLILCYFSPNIFSAFHTRIEKMKNGKRVINYTTVRKCHYCNNFFIKSAEKMKKTLV